MGCENLVAYFVRRVGFKACQGTQHEVANVLDSLNIILFCLVVDAWKRGRSIESYSRKKAPPTLPPMARRVTALPSKSLIILPVVVAGLDRATTWLRLLIWTPALKTTFVAPEMCVSVQADSFGDLSPTTTPWP